MAHLRRNGFLLIAAIILLVFFLNIGRDRYKHKVGISSLSSAGASPDIASFCHAHGFQPFEAPDSKPRQVYDLFLLSHELDWLEIRLNAMAPYVDYFVIVEAPTTFTGIEKPLYLRDNWNNFTKFHDKIIHSVVTDPGPSIGVTTWIHEDFFRNSLFDSTFPGMVGTDKEAYEGDVLLVSDVDEIPKPEAMEILRHCHIPDRLTLRSHFYYYSFQWLHTGEQWAHPQATVFHGLSDTLSPVHLREGIGGPWSWIPFWSMIKRMRQKADLWNAGWHCSSCFATLAEMRSKMSSFSHTPWNTAENRDEAIMLERVRTGQDLFGRKGQHYDRVEANRDVPQYILQNKDTFRYMLDRDAVDGGFRDWRP